MMSAQENEKEAVRTTIVGGRPPGSGRNTGAVPRGIEVLVKKAAVDGKFRELLLDQRGGAATFIGLELDPAEAVMLSAIPQEQLAQIVDQTSVPDEQRRVFLGQVAAAMLAVLGVAIVGCEPPPPEPAGIQPDRPLPKTDSTNKPLPNQPGPPPPPTRGIQPDRPATTPPPVTKGIQPDRP
jgi:hypothetical protein